jgi:predicted RNA-binding Zn-ribbon protein involved in translation (DUF1610 family)
MPNDPRRPDDLDGLTSSIKKLLVGFEDLRTRARELGVFTDERELLSCPSCGLVEDVTCDGLLITYRTGDLAEDTGLRFTETSEGRFTCPACGAEVVPDESEP